MSYQSSHATDCSPLLKLTSAYTHNNHGFPHHRRALPGSWTSQGCYTCASSLYNVTRRTELLSSSDNVGGRTLSAATFASSTLTTESCISFCSSHNYIYAGTEYAVCTISQLLHTHALISSRADVDRTNAVSASWLLPFYLS